MPNHSPSTEGQKLAAMGVPVNLGGASVALRVDNLALIELERRWGSLKALSDELQKGAEGKLFTAVRDVLAACVRDVPVDVAELMDLSQLNEYLEAITAAFEQAGLGGGNGPGNPPRPKGRSRSRGSDSSISASSVSDSVPASSGP